MPYQTNRAEKKKENAYKRKTEDDALRAYHLDRVTSKFKMVISAENVELLAGLLGSDSEEEEGAVL